MAVLRREDLGGKAHSASTACDCTVLKNASYLSGLRDLTGTAGQGPCDQNAPGQMPVTTAQYQCSFGVRVQPVIDRGRRLVHSLGLRPYRVFLVWAERQIDRTFRQHHICELMPVKLLTMDSVELTGSEWGENLIGGVALDDISPMQVTEDNLRGYLDGEDWASKSSEREFYYEIQMHARCAGQLTPRRRRFRQATEPYFNGEQFKFQISLVEQEIPRSRDGVDQTIGTVQPDNTPLNTNRPRLVT